MLFRKTVHIYISVIYNTNNLRFTFIISLSGRRRRGDDGLCRVSHQHQEPVSKETAEDETGMTNTHTHTHRCTSVNDLTTFTLTDHTRAQFSLDRQGCSLPLQHSLRPLFVLNFSFFHSIPTSLSLSLSRSPFIFIPPHFPSSVTALGKYRSLSRCQM